MNHKIARQIILYGSGADEQPLGAGDPGAQLTPEEIFKYTLPAVERLVRQLERTLTHYHNNAGNLRVEKIEISGVLNSNKPFVDYIGEQLGIQSEALDPWEGGRAFLSGVDAPDAPWERAVASPALGLALSTNDQTPNLLFTHEAREAKDSVKRINRIVVAVFLVLLAPVFLLYLTQQGRLKDKLGEKAHLEKKLAAFDPVLDSSKLNLKAVEIRRSNAGIVDASKRYAGLAALNELARITPENIKLLGVTSDFFVEGDKKGEKAYMNLVLEGVVFGDRDLLESTLATYWMRLGESPMFMEALVQSSKIEDFDDQGEVLRFIIKCKSA